MDQLVTTNVGGFPLILNDVRWFLGQIASGNHGVYQAFNNLLRGYGDNFIVQGCVEGGSPGAVTLTEGWVMLGGELLKVDAQAAFDEATDNTFIKQSTFNTLGNKDFQNGSNVDTYQENRAVISGSGGTLAYNGNTLSDLRTIAINGSTIVPLKKKIIDIGDWNMDTTTTVLVAHGLTATQSAAIRSVSVIIRDDGSTTTNPIGITSLSLPQGGIVSVDTNNVQLERLAGGIFDSTSFDATSFNRGWITIEYEG